MGASVRPTNRDPLDAAWERAQQRSDPTRSAERDPLDEAWERAQSRLPSGPPATKDPLDVAWERAQPKPAPAAAPIRMAPVVVTEPEAPARPRERFLPEELPTVQWPAEELEHPAVARHRERFNQTPATVATDRETGATVTVGRPVPIGLPKSEIDRLVADPSLATRIHARLELLRHPSGAYAKAPPAPTFAELAAHVFLDQMLGAAPGMGGVAGAVDESKMEEYVRGGGAFEPWRANVLGLIASGGALTGVAAVGRGLGAGTVATSARSGAAAAAQRLGIPNATAAMSAGAARAVQEIALENQVHPSLAAKIAERARQALVARAPIAREMVASAAGQGVAASVVGTAAAIAQGERDPITIARIAAESGLQYAALGAAFRGLSAEAQFQIGYKAARRSLERAEELRTALATERIRRTPREPGEEFGPSGLPATRQAPPRDVADMEIPTRIRPEPAAERPLVEKRPPVTAPEPRSGPAAREEDPFLVKLAAREDLTSFEKAQQREAYLERVAKLEEETRAAGGDPLAAKDEAGYVAPGATTAQSSAEEIARAPRPEETQPAAGEPGALGRPAGSGAGGAADAPGAGPRGAGVRPGEGPPADAPEARPPEETAPAVRDARGRLRRNVRDVPTEAIADEIVALGDAIGQDPAAPSAIGTEGSGVGFVSVWSGMKGAAAKAAGRNKSRQQAMQRLTAELERRGENVDEALDAALERHVERGGVKAEGERRPGRALEEEEVTPGVMFMPRGPARGEGPDLFGEQPKPAASDQPSMFGGKEGTEAARPLSSAEQAARTELDRLRVIAEKTTDAGVRAKTQRRIAELERLVNRGEKIRPEELGTRAAAERDVLGASDDGPAQQALFSPAGPSTPLGQASARAARDVKTLMEISQNLAAMAGVPLRQGRFNAKLHRALGAFFPQSEVARVVRFDKLDTAAHEVGHYVSLKYLRNPTRRGAAARGAPRLTRPMMRELVKMGRDLYGSRKPAGGYGEEGIAQWAKFYVVDQTKLQQEAPLFAAWMESNVLANEPGLKAALDQARLDFAAYKAAPEEARVDAMIDVKPGFRMLPDPRQLATWYLDDIAEIRGAVEELAALGTTVTPDKHAYLLARLTRGGAGIAEEMIERGIVDPIAGHRLTRGIRQILAGLKNEDVQPLRRYLVAERALEFWERGIDSGISRADAQALATKYAPKYRAIAEELWKVSHALIDYRVAKKNLTAEEGRQIKAKNKRRVGFYRVFEEEEQVRPGAGFGRAFGRNSSGLQRATGSPRDIIDPLESLLTDVYKTVKQAHATEVVAALVEHAERTQGGGRVVEVLTETPQELVAINVEKVKSQLEALGLDPMDLQDAHGMLFALQDRTTASPRETKDLVRPIVISGERKWIQIKDARLYEALSGLGTPELPMWLRIMSIPTRTLRAGATLTFEFMTRNPARDAVTAAVYSRAGFRPPGFDFVLGLFHVLRQDKTYQRWRLGGGDNAAMLGLDRPTVRKHVKDVLRSKTARRVGWVLHPIDTLRILSSLFENATRIGEFAAVEKRALRRGASLRGAQTEGTFASRDVTIDFAQAGTQTRIANQLLAFLNANVRGWAKMLRELKERPAEVVPRLLAWITIPSLLLWWLQKDDEEYQNVPTWQKALAWVIVDRDENGDVAHIWRIPKPPDLGIIFGTIPERIADWIYREDPKALDKFAESLKNLSPLPGGYVPAPNALAPIIEWWANKNLFTGRRIVPEGATDLPAGEQSTSRTGEFARVVGGASGLSPAKLENTIRGYTGGLGQYFLDAANAATRGARDVLDLPKLPTPAKRGSTKLEDVPGVRGFMVRAPLLNAQPVQDVIDLYDAAEARRRGWRKRLQDGDAEGAAQYFRAHEAQIRRVASATDGLEGIGDLRRAHDLIVDAQRLSTDADDATRRRLADIAIDAARDALAGRKVSGGDIRELNRLLAQRERAAHQTRRRSRGSP